MKTAILGAGPSGLALARFLVEEGLSREDIHLFEAAPVVGGLCRSRTVDGFTYDVAGGHILFSKDRATLDWMIECGGGPAGYVKRDRHTRIRFEDRWVNYPFENGLGDLPPQANYDCLEGYVRAWHERILSGSTAPDSFGKWVRWRFGDGIARHFMDPYNEKIWKRGLDELSSDWVAGRVPDAPVEDVLRASVGIRTEGYSHQAVFWYPKQGGFQAIFEGMADPLRDRIRFSTPVRELTRAPGGWRVNGEAFDRIVSTISLSLLPDLAPQMPHDVAGAMRALEYNGLVCLLVALRRAEHPDLSWIYLPHANQGPTNRVTYMSNYAPGNAPEGRSSLLCELTVRGGSAPPDAALETEVVDGLVHAGLITRDEVLFIDRRDTPQAYVVFDHGYQARRAAALGWLEEVGIVPLGRFGRFEYDNSDQCVGKARALAGELAAAAARG